MITAPFAQWLLSVIFVLTFSYAVVGIFRSGTVPDRVAYCLHALMSVAMFAMVWPWGIHALLVPQIVVFTAAAFWFIAIAVSGRASSHDSEGQEGHHDGKRTLVYHGGMMAAMAVMAAGMTTMETSSQSGSGMSMGSMPGMDMSGGGTSGMTMPLWVTLVSTVCAIGFGIAALYFLGSALAAATGNDRNSPLARSRTARATWNLLMAVGMAALFVPLI